jgi:hypothetical protein
MATRQSSSPSHSHQFGAQSKPAPAHTTSLVEQQLRLSVESPQLLAAIEILLPLAKAKYRELSGPRSSGCDPLVAENQAIAWAKGNGYTTNLGPNNPWACDARREDGSETI